MIFAFRLAQKYFSLFFFSMLILNSSYTFSQSLSAEKLIEEFKADDVYQTKRFLDLRTDFLANLNEQTFNLRVKDIRNYLQKNNNGRVLARMFMYERFAYKVFGKVDSLNNRAHYLQIIKLVSPLEDEQLLSDLYFEFGILCAPREKLYYLLKCIEIRERIGVSYFPEIPINYYWACELLYSTSDYKSSASYAARGLTLFKERGKRDFLLMYILTADIAGGAYVKINKPDSALYYYEHISKIITDRIAYPSKYKYAMRPEKLRIWQGVVKGGKAKAYMLEKKYDTAYSLLVQNLKLSNEFKQWVDVADVQNSLAKIDVIRHNIPLAVSRYLQAYNLALKISNLSILSTSAEGAASSFAVQKQYDSAYLYHKRYMHWTKLLDNNLIQSRLDIIKAEVDFDTMQKSLLQSQTNLINQKRIRNSILIAIVLLTAIILLLYNRKILRMKLQRDRLLYEKQKSVTEKRYAQRQIDSFIQNIAEKNGLIQELQNQLTVADNSEVNLKLSQFTILTEDDWQRFKLDFETVHPNYLARLSGKMPQITQTEKRIVMLAKLGLTTREMANATGVSPETIRSGSSRMRKKFNLYANLHTIAKEI